MDDNLYFYHLFYRESSGLHYPESAPVNPADPIDTTSMSTYINVPVNLYEWSSPVTPSITNSDRSPTALPGVAENLGRVAHASCHRTALGRALPSPPTGCDHSTNAHLKPWWPTVEAEVPHAYAPQTAENEGRATSMQPSSGSQVPSGTIDLDAFRESWSQSGVAYHAVAAPAQPASLHNADYPPHPGPAWLYMGASSEVSSISQAHITGLNSVSSRMADAVLGNVPSPANLHRYHRGPHARLEHVVCDKCKKLMRRQSLRRHIREVHDHVKRGHAKSSFPAGS